MEQHTFGYWLRLRRKALDLTRNGLAERVGCSAATIRKLEAEERRPSAQIVERLADIFNVPAAERRAFHQFARGDWRAGASPSLLGAPLAPARPPARKHLPAPITSLVGREREIAEVRALCRGPAARLVTLVGPPGIGKTRLSIEVAQAARPDFLDGASFVALAPVDDPARVPAAIGESLGYVGAPHQPALDLLLDGIGDKHLLLVVDNCEHVIEAVAALASQALAACPRLVILATSREALRVAGEWRYEVPALAVPQPAAALDPAAAAGYPGLALFAERARAVRADFRLAAGNLPAVAALCAQVDGLPLGIELIAARVRLLSPQALLERLSEHEVLSADGRRAAPAHQKTLRASIGWSYDMLVPAEQQLLARLAVFSGGFTVAAAEAIFAGAGDGRPAADLLMSLLDKSLVQRTRDAYGEPRFGLLVTIQQFGLERLREAASEPDARQRHLAYFAALAEEGAGHMHGPGQVEWINRLDAELDNFRAALDWCVSRSRPAEALRLFNALGWAWGMRGHYGEARVWFDRIRPMSGISGLPELVAGALNHVGRYHWVLGDFREAQALLEEGRALWQALGASGEVGLAEALDWLGMVARWGRGDSVTAQALFQESFTHFEKHGCQWHVAQSTMHLALIEYDLHHNAAGQALLEQSFEIFHQLGDIWGMARLSHGLGDQRLMQGDYAQASHYFHQQLSLDLQLQFNEGVAVAHRNLGNLHRHQGDLDQAEQSYAESLAVCREFDLKDDWARVLYALALVALQRADYGLAQQRFLDLFDLTRRVYAGQGAHDLLAGLAAVAAGTQQPERAAILQGAAQTINATLDTRPKALDQAELSRHLQLAREQLGDERFRALGAEGRAMTLEQAIGYALTWAGSQGAPRPNPAVARSKPT